MVNYKILYTKTAQKQIPFLKAAGLSETAKSLIELLKENPFKTPPAFERLKGDMQGVYSRRINVKHRLVYEVFCESKTVKILSMWSHYET